ncbi:unnamed protein product [Arabidopsis thaliana]|uniref:DNA-binding bromodomain-containing protein n=1 Tax=Arabidopsis thaliana TaxID=3702 RepID=A0A5S9XLT5_ARATH|nr:unnamed protein product [Arabidopsis thaliana]VYS60740.1 unnamed protein product [Arabidopsis thaliana]
MAKSENDKNSPEKQTWSTMEELLLACAVHRHGTDSWDSVASEVHKQNSTFRTLTAIDCRHKYNDLKRRFSRNLVSPGSADEETLAAEISSVPWLEELRKLRVDELRREVERYDLSISSLQLKVKTLEDEREKSLKTENSDLDRIAETKENHTESGNNSGVPVTELKNSPDPNDISPGTGSENTNRAVKIAEPVDEEPNRIGGEDNDEKPAREDSGRGSCESVAKESDRAEPKREGNDSPELVESMDESKGEEDTKETSDGQSSASFPRKETVDQDQPDNKDQSLTVNKIFVESQPLSDFIEILQSHPIGSHFSRRLETQETSDYYRIIRQHIDFEMIRSRVEEGYYKTARTKFFRDLLLLINNVRVFYGEPSPEFNAAKQLYQLIKKQMSFKIPKQTLPPPKEDALVTSKEEVKVSSLKPTLSVPIIACRKRSSLAVRSPASVTETLKKKTRVVPTVDEKQVSEEEEGRPSDKDEKPIVSKKMARGAAPSTAKKVGSRNVKTSLNAGISNRGRSPNGSSVLKKSVQQKKGINTSGGSKKQSAASFLKRMKGVSSSETVVETVKAESSNGKRGAEQRKSNSKSEKVDAVKLPAGQKRLTGKRPTIEKGSPTKKNSGVASKRGTASLMAKRDSETSEKETGSSNRPKKRSKR